MPTYRHKEIILLYTFKIVIDINMNSGSIQSEIIIFRPKAKTLYGHFLSTCPLPDSSYSCDEIHICWKVPMLANIEPPIQAPNRRSTDPLAEIILSRVLDGARWARSRFSRSGKP